MSTPTIDKQNILDKIKTKFEAVSSSGGEYFYSYSGKVHLNKLSPFQTFGINIRDDFEQASQIQEQSRTKHDMDLYVEIDIVCPDAAEIAKIYKYEADLLKCIGNNLTWESLAFYTFHESSTRNRADQQGNKISDMTIRIRIQYRKNAFNI